MREAEGMGAQRAGTMEGRWLLENPRWVGRHVEIVIDRPKGTSHPQYPDSIYPVDYGYLRDTASMDGSGIDVWVGTGLCGIDAIICVADLVKGDSEIKILIDCTEEEKRLIFGVHNETENMKGVLVRRKPPRS